ncbi:heme ABC transporter ATP-binding protein [Arcanobacterium canis]|uniref:Heme ABC transporter ATP-binding protein n=1 Tax=Arcanobacterium canis TaxID=999183 RepID=A0ABY8FX51_9ACTO|nr:heme ABC transporter ATP-binding protein [Arcanobacterium canis]WFM83094.1 heme ABC transporter ATP-binding protein [Arcanobacterium canis]
MRAVSAQNLTFSYGHTPVLKGVNLDVNAGEVVGLLGPNGSGKSTLIGVLAGDLKAHGTVLIHERPLEQYTRKQLAQTRSVMEQSGSFPFDYLCGDIVAMGRLCWASSPEEDARIVELSMVKAQVSEYGPRVITQLSGGQRSRVTFARVLAQEAQVVFLDEPTAALDIAHQKRTLHICNELAREGHCVIAVMHDIQVAASHCDRIALMNDGKIVAYGTPREVLKPSTLTQVYGWPIDVLEVNGRIIVIPTDGR